MTVPEGRLATLADAQAVLQAQNSTARAIGITAWTSTDLAGFVENAAMARPNYYIVVAPTAADGSVEGFMLIWRARNPDLNDATLVEVKLVCSLILGDGNDAARLRRVLISTFRFLTTMCEQQALAWEAWFPKSVAKAFAVDQFAQEMTTSSKITITAQQRGTVNGFIVTSAPVVVSANTVWPNA